MKTNEDVSPYVCMLRGNFMPPHHTNFCWISQLWGANYFRQFQPLWNNGTSFLCRGFGGHFLFLKNKQTNKNEIVIWFPYTSVKKVKQELTPAYSDDLWFQARDTAILFNHIYGFSLSDLSRISQNGSGNSLLETRRKIEPKCVPQVFLGTLLGTRLSAIGQFFPCP